MIRTFVALSVFAGMLCAQRSVSPGSMYHRVYAVIPMTGSGTTADPKRPMLLPTMAELLAQHQAGQQPDLLAYSSQTSDDGKFALVEMVFTNPISYHNFLSASVQPPSGTSSATHPLSAIPSSVQGLKAVPSDGSDVHGLNTNIASYTNALQSGIPGLQLFERGKVTDATVLAAFRAHKKNYTFGSSTVRPQ